MEQTVDAWQSTLGAIARRARAAARDIVPQVEELTAPLTARAPETSDLEVGSEEPRWASWAKQAAGHVRQKAAGAAEQAHRGLSQGLEKARTVDWTEQVRNVQGKASSATATLQGRVAQGVERAKTVEWTEHAKCMQEGVSRGLEMATKTASSASIILQEKGQAAQKTVSEMSGRGLQTLSDSQVLQKAKDNVSSVAGAAKGALSVAGGRVSAVTALTMSPAKLGQFAAVFVVGVLFIVLSFNFLPIILLAPQKFALLFTIGSVTILSSFGVLNGPLSLVASLAKWERLPFTVPYLTGLIGTLWATLILRSFIFTALFAVLQAISLVYFVILYLPGGKAGIGLLWRLGCRSARSIAQV